MTTRHEYVQAGLEANPDDSAYRLAEEYDHNRGLAKTRDAGLELLTPQAIERLYQRNPNAVRQAVHQGRISGKFEIAGTRGGSPVRMFLLSDVAEVWGTPDEATLAKMRVEAKLIAIGGRHGQSSMEIGRDRPGPQAERNSPTARRH